MSFYTKSTILRLVEWLDLTLGLEEIYAVFSSEVFVQLF